MTFYRQKYAPFTWIAGLIALLLLTVEIAAACSLAPPNPILRCPSQDNANLWIDGYNKSAGNVYADMVAQCPEFADVAEDTFSPIYKTWDAGVQRDFFEYSMLTIEPYSAEQEATLKANPDTCRENVVERHGEWLFSYGVLQPYCSVNPGDGASCPFVELNNSELRNYCALNSAESICEKLPENSIDPRIIIGGSAAVALVGIGGALIVLIRRTGDD